MFIYLPRKQQNPNSSNVMVSEVGPLEVIGSQGWSPYEWNYWPYKRDHEGSSPFQHENIVRSGPCMNLKWTFTRQFKTAAALILGFGAPDLWCLMCKPSSLLYFTRASWIIKAPAYKLWEAFLTPDTKTFNPESQVNKLTYEKFGLIKSVFSFYLHFTVKNYLHTNSTEFCLYTFWNLCSSFGKFLYLCKGHTLHTLVACELEASHRILKEREVVDATFE